MTNNQDIFSHVTPANVSDRWKSNNADQPPFLWETMMPADKQSGSHVEFYVGQNTGNRPLAPSGFDETSNTRGRTGMKKVQDDTRFFKEGMTINEKQRQQLLNIANSNNQALKDGTYNHIFNDLSNLLASAQLTREIMRNQVIQTGAVTINAKPRDGITYNTDSYMDSDQFSHFNWLNNSAKPLEDLSSLKQKLNDKNGAALTKMVMNQRTYDALLTSNNIKASMYVNNANVQSLSVPSNDLDNYISNHLGLTIQVYNKTYIGYDGKRHKFIGDGHIVMLPDGDLGTTMFSVTPEEADLYAMPNNGTSLTDGGVAVSQELKTDPVNKKINVSQMVLPILSQADSILNVDIDDVAKEAQNKPAPAPSNNGNSKSNSGSKK